MDRFTSFNNQLENTTMYGIFIIFFFFALGNLLSWFIGGYIPGSVIGMVLLFLSLTFKLISPEKVKTASTFLVKNMALFFVPVGAGVMVSGEFFKGNFLALTASVIISTILVLLSTGFIQQKFEQWKK